MKKKVLCFILATTITVLTACGGGSSDSPSTSEPTKAEATPTEATVVEPTEAATPTEVAEEPTPEDSGYVIKGVDFEEYMNKFYSARELRDKCELEELSLIFFDLTEKGSRAPFEDGGYDVIKNGETYHCTPNDSHFQAYLYSPKQMEVATFVFTEGGAPEKLYDRESNAMNADTLSGQLQSIDFYEGGTVTKEIYITYEDGTEETFTFTVTDQ